MLTEGGENPKFVIVTLAVAAEAGSAPPSNRPTNPQSNGNIGCRTDLFIFIEPYIVCF